MKFAHAGALLAATLIAVAAPNAARAAKAAPKTVSDLKAAYKGESTASAKYAAYAKQAQKEGYKDVASTFRAASQAEAIHARNHRKALAGLGVKNPTPGRYTAKPGTTRANLQDALKGETYEKDTMYPRMIKDAGAESQGDAGRSMEFALDTERQHATLYAAALKNLKAGQATKPFYVCPVCGATYAKTAPADCIICGTPKKEFQKLT